LQKCRRSKIELSTYGVILLFFEGNETHLMLETIGESNNVGVWGLILQPARGKLGFGGGSPDAEAILQFFFPKNTHF